MVCGFSHRKRGGRMVERGRKKRAASRRGALGGAVGGPLGAKIGMVRRRHPPSQGWRTFIRNHADGIAAMDLFVVPTISFHLLYGLLIMRHGRRHILWFGVTAHPTAEWIANQVT